MKKYLKLATAFLLLAATTACQKEKDQVEYNFIGNIERYTSDSTDSRSKVMLINEQFINWEIGDIISIGSDQTSNPSEHYSAYLVRTNPNGSGDFDHDFSAAFLSVLPENSKYFLALFPHTNGNIITGTDNSTSFTAKIDLKATQPVRNDSTFDREIYPMVAWYGGQWTTPEDVPYNLDFHSLCGIVRLQVFNASGNNKVLKEIRISSLDNKQLAGRFNVLDYNTNDPYLTPDNNIAANQTLTLSCGSGLEFNANTLRTFYVILPALGGRLVSTDYHLSVTVETMDGGTCQRNTTVSVRRTGITNIRALGINSWDGAGSIAGLAGNGTESRPFKVYTYTDLVYLRNAYNTTRRINGQPVTRNTHIRIMRSDILIPNDDSWGGGIMNFCGHLSAVSGASTPGISTNNNFHPLFHSITDSGVVEGITLKAEVNYNGTTTFSPFCLTNRGILKDCVLTNRSTTSVVNANYADLAAICVDNYGTIDGCRCDATLQASGHIVGCICLNNANAALIKGCQITSPMNVRTATQVGGICHTNAGTVKDSYFSASITQSSSSWGGIVYNNSGIVEHCANMGIITTDTSVGGVVNTVTGGTVDYCYVEVALQGNMVGGVACNVTGGTVINSFINTASTQLILRASSFEHNAGGIAANFSGGSIKNCFVYFPHVAMYDLTGNIGGIVGKATGGSVSHCYSYESGVGTHYFYGASSDVSYERCYLVNGASQSGIDAVSTATTNAFEIMQGNLNINPPAGAKLWTGASESTTPPHLEAYSSSAKRKRR